jgi:hypothetical protein
MQLENVKPLKDSESFPDSKKILLPSEPESSIDDLNRILKIQGYEITPLNDSPKKTKRKILGFDEFKK